MDINDNNINKFNKLINKNGKIAVVIFHATWCGHCIEFGKYWNEIKKKSKSIKKHILLARVEEKMLNSIKINNNIKGFPTITLFNSGKKIKDYNGIRDTENFIKFLNDNAKSIKHKINKKVNTKKIAKKLKTKKYSKLLKKLNKKYKKNTKKNNKKKYKK